jgi:2-iminobutanoate/2-iminopropanoate deaminase
MPRTILSRDAPAPIGPYSQAVAHQGILYCSGQIGIDPLDGALAQGADGQTWRCLSNIDAILHGLGITRDRILRCTLYLVDMTDFDAVNRAYAEFFGEYKPARTTVQVAALPRGALVEIEATAAL